MRLGDLAGARALLGRNFGYRGAVVRGAGRGNQIGFPTANVETGLKLVLPLGVYAVWVTIPGASEKRIAGVTNLGVRPTFQGLAAGAASGEPVPLVETHLFDFHRDLYGKTIQVEFVARLREERKFAGVQELRLQINKDIDAARQILSSQS